jgi:hypothetical protein
MWFICYLAGLSKGRFILWCYLIWYLVVLARYFDPAPTLWLTSLGLSGIIGMALYISATASPGSTKPPFWPTARLFMMPFCVSSFAALVKGRGFVLVFSPRWIDSAIALAVILAFACMAGISRRVAASQKMRGN